MASAAAPPSNLPTLDKVSISGPAISSLIRTCSSTTTSGDCDGILFGHFRHPSPSKSLRDDDDNYALAAVSDHQNPVCFVTGFVCSGRPQSFYDGEGNLDSLKVSTLLSSSTSRQPDSSSIVGWFVGRRHTPLRPSMREHAVSCNLMNLNSNKTLNLNLDSSIPPCVFLIVSNSLSLQSTIHTHQYRAFQMLPSWRFSPKTLDIINAGPVFHGHYDVFSPISSFPWSSPPRKGEEVSGGRNKGPARGRKETDLEKVEQVSSKLIGPDARHYTANLEDLYKMMLAKLGNLVQQVESSSATLLEQEKHNSKLRAKLAGLE